MMKQIALVAAALMAGSSAEASADKPAIVLVHGAFADASSWNGVIHILERDGYPVTALANPLRSLSGDAAYVADAMAGISGPKVLVGHSYGGSVITEAVAGRDDVRALVYVSAFAPEAGESVLELSNRFPGSTLAPTLAPPVALADGGMDIYIRQERFPAQFAADLPRSQALLMAAGQRPVTDAALAEPATFPAWKSIPSWFIYGDADLNIPPAAMAFMAARAHAHEAVVVPGASHVVMVSHPEEVAALIEKAAMAGSEGDAHL